MRNRCEAHSTFWKVHPTPNTQPQTPNTQHPTPNNDNDNDNDNDTGICRSVCLCLFQLGLALSSAVPDQQRSCSCFSLCSSVSQQHISHLFVRAMAAAAWRRSAKSTPGRSTNQSWSPNSGQVTEEAARPYFDARFRARTAAATGPNTGCVGSVPAFWERPDSTCSGALPHLVGKSGADAASGLSALSTRQTNASVLLAACVVSNSAMAKRVCHSGPIETPNVLTNRLNVSMVELLTITSYTQNNPRIRTQLMLLHVNVTALLRLLQTQRSSCRLHRTRIKPPRPHLQSMTRLCPAVKELYDWTKKPWTSIGSRGLRGIASRTFAAPRMFSHCQGSKFALQQAQHDIFRAITFHGPSSLASEPAWKALVLSSWLLLGRPAVNASESNCAHFLDARLYLL